MITKEFSLTDRATSIHDGFATLEGVELLTKDLPSLRAGDKLRVWLTDRRIEATGPNAVPALMAGGSPYGRDLDVLARQVVSLESMPYERGIAGCVRVLRGISGLEVPADDPVKPLRFAITYTPR